MTKTLKFRYFRTMTELCNFVNENGITQENIQAISSGEVVVLYYWEITE